MKTEEDEAFDELAKRQGDWGGGYQAKRQMAADKLEDDPLAELDGILERLAAGNYTITEYKGTYDVGYMMYARDILAAEKEKNMERDADKLQEALYGMNQDDWKDVVAAIAKVRDGRGIYLGCRPADVFQEWFLALGTAKVKEKRND